MVLSLSHIHLCLSLNEVVESSTSASLKKVRGADQRRVVVLVRRRHSLRVHDLLKLVVEVQTVHALGLERLVLQKSSFVHCLAVLRLAILALSFTDLLVESGAELVEHHSDVAVVMHGLASLLQV